MFKQKLIFSAVAAAMVVFAGSAAYSEEMKPFGGQDSVDYATQLWSALEKARLAGANAIHAVPYEGQEPHGAILETLDSTITVGGHSGVVIVKNNYGPEGITTEDVANDPAKHLKAVTVMFKREKGYDAEDKDWFWVKYTAKGSVLKNPAGVSLAGRVAKGMDAGCIACHTGASGGDLVFNNDRFM